MKTNIKIIATSLALTSSFGAWAGIGGLSVQSHLGQPFSGSIVVTESGIRDKTDVDLMRAHGVNTFLIGETFMRAVDIVAEVKKLY